MTREHAKKLLPIIQAFANGEDIQINEGDNSNPQWVDIDCPAFTGCPSLYRIKFKPREWYLVRPVGCLDLIAYSNPVPAYKKMVKVREILD